MKKFIRVAFLIAFLLVTTKARAEIIWEKSSLDGMYISKLITTPYGILTGEFDSRIWMNPPPYNGVRLSRDFGSNWNQTGLEKMGVTDLSYDNGVIYASTYYSNPNYKNGIYYSTDGGKSWQHGGYTGSVSKVLAYNGTIYLAGVSRGLWISKDMGTNWELKIGDQYLDYEITSLAGNGGIVIACTISNAYISKDNGDTWSIISDLDPYTIIGTAFGNESIIAISRENKILISQNDGKNWEKIQDNPNLQPEKIYFFQNTYYLSQKDLTNGLYDIYTSNDSGATWNKTDLDKTHSITSITGAFGSPSKLLTYVNLDSVYTTSVNINLGYLPILETPWNKTNTNELTSRIYSYFDHKYPLLGYSYLKEPEEEANTTINYLGEEAEIPDLYYSSHDGYDFSLSYGTEILAAHEGLAEYYYCKPCGNTIKINHPNGYQTTYMHLQDDGLITRETKSVQSGDIIGRVGMTGNTTGPHLHFAVTNNLLYPENRTDPFGWQEESFPDPWEVFSWKDVLGDHTGSKSIYLWKDLQAAESKYLLNENIELELGNKKAYIPNESTIDPTTLLLKESATPIISRIQKNLISVPDTSFSIEAINNLGEKIINLYSPVKIEITLPTTISTNIVGGSLKIFYLNNVTKLWEPLSTLYDSVNNILKAYTWHFSDFAVFGEMLDSYTPHTTNSIEGNLINHWYNNKPLISLSTGYSNDKTFYSTEGEFWKEYTSPFELDIEGITVISYRSMAENSNLEDTKYELIRVNTDNSMVKTVIIKGAEFTTL